MVWNGEPPNLKLISVLHQEQAMRTLASSRYLDKRAAVSSRMPPDQRQESRRPQSLVHHDDMSNTIDAQASNRLDSNRLWRLATAVKAGQIT